VDEIVTRKNTEKGRERSHISQKMFLPEQTWIFFCMERRTASQSLRRYKDYLQKNRPCSDFVSGTALVPGGAELGIIGRAETVAAPELAEVVAVPKEGAG
jgi:hypothetical protein